LKKQSRAEFGAAMLFKLKLFLNGSVNGAGLCAVSAIDACLSVDNELAVTLSNSLNGAICSACAASDAIIGNLKCHGYVPPFFDM
jgi:hypothetical protein